MDKITIDKQGEEPIRRMDKPDRGKLSNGERQGAKELDTGSRSAAKEVNPTLSGGEIPIGVRGVRACRGPCCLPLQRR